MRPSPRKSTRKRPLPKPAGSIGKAGKKGTTVEEQQRRSYAAKLLSLGLTSVDTIEHLKEYGCGTKQARRAVAAARQLMRQREERGRSRAREEMVIRLESYLYGAIVEKGPVPDLIAIEKLLADVLGTRLREREEKKAPHARREALHATIDGMSDDELDRLVAEEIAAGDDEEEES